MKSTLLFERTGSMRAKRKNISFSKVVIFVLLLIYAVFLSMPFFTIIMTSITSNVEAMSSMSFIWWPEKPTLENYILMFTMDPFKEELAIPTLISGFMNTMWTALLSTLVGLLVSGLAAYAYAKLQVPGKNIFFMIEMATMMIPMGAFVVTGYLFYSWLGWAGTYLPIIIPPMFGGAITIFFLRTYFEGLPKEIFEAAKIDGLGTMGVFFKIVLPLSGPAFIAQFIFNFVSQYNNYMGPLLYLDRPAQYTLQLALAELQSNFGGANIGVNCACALVALVPLIIVYCFSNKFFIEGIAAGGVKE